MSCLCRHLRNASEDLETLSVFVEENALRAGLNGLQVNRILLVLEEAVLNIIHHAYGGEGGKLELRCTPLPDGLEISLSDEGPPFNPLGAPALKVDTDIASHKIGGMGIHLIRGLTDALSYCREGERNVLTLHFLLKSGEGP